MRRARAGPPHGGCRTPVGSRTRRRSGPPSPHALSVRAVQLMPSRSVSRACGPPSGGLGVRPTEWPAGRAAPQGICRVGRAHGHEVVPFRSAVCGCSLRSAVCGCVFVAGSRSRRCRGPCVAGGDHGCPVVVAAGTPQIEDHHGCCGSAHADRNRVPGHGRVSYELPSRWRRSSASMNASRSPSRTASTLPVS